jgi:3-dehydrosphinganine reductase
MTRLAGAHVLVAGGSDGIGFATAGLCQRRGARVSILGRRVEQLDLARRRVRALATARGDVTDAGSLRSAVDELTGVNGSCDVVVACAGGAVPGYVEQLDIDTFRAQVELNHLGTVNTVQAVPPACWRGDPGTWSSSPRWPG